MPVIKDPEGFETTALHAMLDFRGLSVLEVGCGDGRLTWRYADQAEQVTGIDPDEKAIQAARTNTPARLQGRVSFHASPLTDFVALVGSSRFDLVLFSWSL